MITATNKNTVQRSGVKSEGKFQIKATGKAFRILSDGLYSDKIRAIIRELSCNAYDAHVDAGNTDKPFDVQLPSKLAPMFRIRDYGIGLNQHDVEHVYTTYFESTKTESNDFVGCLGLGSKSPFSYVDNFSITSFFKGKKYVYNAFLSEDDTPAIALLSETDTTEPNGLEVSFPVKVEDCHQFEYKAEDVYTYFKLQPNVLGAEIDIETPEYIMDGDGWGISKNRNGGAKAIMGNVAYPLNDINDDLTNDQRNLSRYIPIDIHFNIGELEVAASRESLSYNKATVATVQKRFNKVITEIRKDVEERIKNAPTLWDARIEAYKLIKGEFSIIKNLLENQKFVWNGTPITIGYVEIDKALLEDINIESFSFKSYYRRYQQRTGISKSKGQKSIQVSSKIRLYRNDLTVGSNVRCKQVMTENNEDAAGERIIEKVYLVHGSAAKVQELADLLGIAKIEPISVIERKKENRANTNANINPLNGAKVIVYDDSEADEDNASSYWVKDDLRYNVRKAEGGIFVEIDRYKINDSNPDIYIEKMLDVLRSIEEDADFEIVGVRWKVAEDLKAAGNWKSLGEHVKARAAKYLKDNKLGERIVLGRELSQFENTFSRFSFLKEMAFEASKPMGKFIKMLTEAEALVGDRAEASKMTNIAYTCGIQVQEESDIDLDKAWGKVLNHYKLLASIDAWRAEQSKQAIEEYVNALDLLK